MTPADTAFLVLAILQGIAVAVMLATGIGVLETVRRARKGADPALARARAVAAGGRSLVEHAREDATGSVERSRKAWERVRARFARVARIAREMLPQAQGAAEGVVREQQQALGVARRVGGIARGLGRVKGAAEAAARAARSEPGD